MRQAEASEKFEGLRAWLEAQLRKLSRKTPLAAPIRYALGREKRMPPYLEDGRLELDNNTAERAMRVVAPGRKNSLLAGSEAGGKSAAITHTLTQFAKFNDVGPRAGPTHLFDEIATIMVSDIDQPMPWIFQPSAEAVA